MIPTKEQNPNGFHQRYVVSKINGEPIGDAEYFVLRLDLNGDDQKHIQACRKAILTYANEIESHIPDLAKDLRERYA